MKITFFTILASILFATSSYAVDCADISGKYIHTKVGHATRVLTIQQKSCGLFVVKLDNGSPGNEETVWATNKPYTYYAHDKSGDGQTVPNGQPIETSLKDRFQIASFSGASLRVMQVIGWRMPGDKCILDATKYQPDCSVNETIYSLKDRSTLVETQNGSHFIQGNMIPDVFEYKRIN